MFNGWDENLVVVNLVQRLGPKVGWSICCLTAVTESWLEYLLFNGWDRKMAGVNLVNGWDRKLAGVNLV